MRELNAYVVVAALATFSVNVFAQEPGAKPARVPLRLQVVISKYQGEKKLSSLPYSVSFNANDTPVRMRMGAEVPIPTTIVKDGNSSASYTYRNLGVAIDIGRAEAAPEGAYRLDVSVSDTSLVTPSGTASGATIPSQYLSGAPAFRSFSVLSTILLKDGQSSQMTTAADPTTGDVMRVDVTLTIVK
jgi:hypothetical protein